MNKIIEADQSKPYELIKNIFKHNSQYKEMLYIVKYNRPDLSIEEIVEMFKKLSNSGCSVAMVANAIGNYFYNSDDEFKNIFGFPLLGNNGSIDYNRILIDIYSKLYGVAKVRFIEYETYEFDSIKEAGQNLLGLNLDDNTILVELMKKGISADGYTRNGKLKYKNNNPIIKEYVGTANEISNQKFGIDCNNSFDDLKKICNSKNIIFECKNLEIESKLTGLTNNNFNYWIDYYFEKSGINYTIESENINNSDYNNYEEFKSDIVNLINEGYLINVSVGPNNEARMHTNKKYSWTKIGGDKVGHMMLFKNFNNEGDIVVSSYGEDYIIPKEFFNMLEFKKMKKIEKIRENNNNKSM